MNSQIKASLSSTRVKKSIIFLNSLVSLIYLGWWFIPGHHGNLILYLLLLFGEIYHVSMSLTFWYTIWPRKKEGKNFLNPNQKKAGYKSVDIFITVAGEPANIVEQTIQAAKNIDYPNFNIFLLNDGFVVRKNNWQEIEDLAKKYGINFITRKLPGGAKAGNINNALKVTNSEIVAIFDADMKPKREFLKTVIPYFNNEKVGFVQTPQYYSNYSLNSITKGAWEQQEFFFGPIMVNKDNLNSSFICGTNFAIRRKAINQIGGLYEKSIAEDFLTSLLIQQKGWISKYIPQVLAEGLAPEDLLSYYRQQYRWARGSLEILFKQNPFLKKGLTLAQKLQYFASGLFYFNGVVVLIDIVMPLFFLFFAIRPVSASTTNFSLFFIPFIILNLFTLYLSSANNLTFRAISFTQASFVLQLSALKSLITNKHESFFVTKKKAQTGSFVFLSYPHLFYTALVFIGIIIGINRDGLTPALATNISWALFNVVIFIPYIFTSFNPDILPSWQNVLTIRNISFEKKDP